jgi:hypothetical protein
VIAATTASRVAPFVATALAPFLAGGCDVEPPADPPYPASAHVAAFVPDFTRLVLMAPGSDNWAITWGADGAQYATWGDGGGFGGTDQDGRVSLGVARIEGSPPDFRGTNLWGGKDARAPATFEGKSYGILSVDGVLYLWVGPGAGIESYRESRLASSRDGGLTWTRADWAFPESTDLAMPTLLQFGRDGAGARDEWVYSYFIRRTNRGPRLQVHRPGAIDLARAPRGRILERDAWEFFAGSDAGGTPRWTADETARRPVFEDPAGVGWCVSATYLPGIDRIVLCTEHQHSFHGNLGMFESVEPWGPWGTIAYTWGFGVPHVRGRSFFWTFAPAWCSGTDAVLVFSGIEELDCWASVPGRLVLRNP